MRSEEEDRLICRRCAGFVELQNQHAQVKPILLGAALVGVVVLGSGAYLLTRPCVMSECQRNTNC